MNRIQDDDLDAFFAPRPDPPMSKRAQEWNRLIELCPELAQVIGYRPNKSVPPQDLTTFMFLAFIACFADPRRAAILRTVIFDNQQENLSQVIAALLTRDGHDNDETN